MTPNEQAQWAGHLQTPVIFNHHEPIEINSSSIKHVDLNPITSTPKAVANEERVLILTPLRNAAPYIEQHFDLLSQLTYPHKLIDLAFLVGDSTDDTLAVLSMELERIQSRTDSIPFRSAMIVTKDFGVGVDQDVESRHGFAAQGPRRKAMGRARNYLLSAAMKPEHSWIYWRDVDIKDSPNRIIEDFIAHDRDILVPSMDPSLRGTDYHADRTQMFGFTDMKTDTISRVVSTTIPGRSRRKVSSLRSPSTRMSCWPKVRLLGYRLSFPQPHHVEKLLTCVDVTRLQGVSNG
jgi:hypothetical protein